MGRPMFEDDVFFEHDEEHWTPGRRASLSVAYLLGDTPIDSRLEKGQLAHSQRLEVPQKDGSRITIIRSKRPGRYADLVRVESHAFDGARVVEDFSWNIHMPDEPRMQRVTSDIGDESYTRLGFNDEDWQWLRANLDKALTFKVAQDQRLRRLVRMTLETDWGDVRNVEENNIIGQLSRLSYETGLQADGITNAWELVEAEMSDRWSGDEA